MIHCFVCNINLILTFYSKCIKQLTLNYISLITALLKADQLYETIVYQEYLTWRPGVPRSAITVSLRSLSWRAWQDVNLLLLQ